MQFVVRSIEQLCCGMKEEETMARKRFKWTRKAYQHAAWLSRFMARHVRELPDQPPDLLRRYWELWQRYPERGDPLAQALAERYPERDLPF